MLTNLYVRLMNSLKNEKGQGMVEYALIIGLVAVILIGAIVAFRGQIANLFQSLTDGLANPGQ